MQASVDPQSSPSSVRVSTALSISTQNNTPTPDVVLVEPRPLEKEKSALMEFETVELTPQITQLEKKPTGPAKTWKRMGNESDKQPGPNHGDTQPIPYRVVGKTRKSPLQTIPTMSGKLCMASSISFPWPPGTTQPVTRWSDSAIARKTRADMRAWTRSPSPARYLSSRGTSTPRPGLNTASSPVVKPAVGRSEGVGEVEEEAGEGAEAEEGVDHNSYVD
ncbi:seven transmembrane MLO family protein [Striga asiatica]|uniref:Seven transmembrane MLO family protein n=1 Tax=Striga asiatica TaxID=4170 RepID=A0A5A7QX28_STRAF|nr:seven transmembrane MLO family protein [Striga asiatica]